MLSSWRVVLQSDPEAPPRSNDLRFRALGSRRSPILRLESTRHKKECRGAARLQLAGAALKYERQPSADTVPLAKRARTLSPRESGVLAQARLQTTTPYS